MHDLRNNFVFMYIPLCLVGIACQQGLQYTGPLDGAAGLGGGGFVGSAGASGTGGSTDAPVDDVANADAGPVEGPAEVGVDDAAVDVNVDGADATFDAGHEASLESGVEAHPEGGGDTKPEVGGSCQALDNPMNGTVATPALTTGSVAEYTCGMGYSIDGSAERTCDSDGNWSGLAPTCSIVSCPPLAAPTGGLVSVPSVVYQSSAKYSCDTGYSLSGNTTRTCEADGSWTGTVPTCSPIQVSVSVELKGPLGQGSVLSDTPGVTITCGSTCSALVAYGTQVELVASATSTGAFESWSGCTTTGGTMCIVSVGTSDVTVIATFKSKNGGACGDGNDCDSGFCVNGTCCNSACKGPCNGSCSTGTCNPLPARTACGTIAGPGGTGSDVVEICDGMGNCKAPTIRCPTGGAVVSCDLSANYCCYESTSSFEESCNPTACAGFGQSCAATADCPTGQYCCEVSLAAGPNWAACATAAVCSSALAQYCDPTATTSGCLQGACHDGGTNELSVCE
jgi:hypothetical protein